MGDNVAHNPIGMVHNAPLASAPGKELQPLILSTLVIQGVQFKREIIERFIGEIYILVIIKHTYNILYIIISKYPTDLMPRCKTRYLLHIKS